MLTAMTLLVLGLGGYAVLCAVKPFAPCRRCRGLGAVSGRLLGERTCPRCRGDRLRLRVGRRLHNAWRRTREAGAR